MNTHNPHPDELLRNIFSAIPAEEPSADFTEKILGRLPSDQTLMQPVHEAPFNIGFRAAIALLLTVSFFALLIFTSDFSFTDWIFRFSGNLARDFSFNSLLFLLNTMFAKIFNFRFLSIVAGVVFLIGGSLMVLYRYSDERKGLPHAGLLMIL